MDRSLRKRHAFMWLVLAPVLIAASVLVVVSRGPAPHAPSGSPATEGATP